LPEFFINFLTDPGDLVVDIFAGSNTTGEAAESLGRRWLALEKDREYVVASAFRFMADWSEERIRQFVKACDNGPATPIRFRASQRVMF
nr:site-specific DNA-methyltransferase [Planctomycetota bacterium]